MQKDIEHLFTQIKKTSERSPDIKDKNWKEVLHIISIAAYQYEELLSPYQIQSMSVMLTTLQVANILDVSALYWAQDLLNLLNRNHQLN